MGEGQKDFPQRNLNRVTISKNFNYTDCIRNLYTDGVRIINTLIINNGCRLLHNEDKQCK